MRRSWFNSVDEIVSVNQHPKINIHKTHSNTSQFSFYGLALYKQSSRKKEKKWKNSSIPYLEKKERRWSSCFTGNYEISLEWEKKAGVLNPLKYKIEGMDANAGGSPLPATKIAAEMLIIRAYIRLD